MIHMEVQALMSANPGMSSADCAKQCDAMFDLMDSTDESTTDQQCAGACNWLVEAHVLYTKLI